MRYLLIATALLICACGQKNTDSSTEELETFADPQIEAYQKAQQVEGILQKSQDDMRKRIDAE